MNSIPNLALGLKQLVLAIDSTQVHNQSAIDALGELVQPAICFAAHCFFDAASAFS